MTNADLPERELKSTSYELFILLLSLLSIFNLAVLLLPQFSPIVKGVVMIMDGFITVAFMSDFLYRLFTAQSKRQYFFRNWGWADLLASMPVQQLKVFRLFRIVKAATLLHDFGARRMVNEIRCNMAGSALFTTLFLVFIVVQFGGSAMVYIESSAPNANIASPSDAVWWALVTITTVGYGDHYPVTNTGRLVGMAVMMLGVGLFGVLTGFLANAFVTARDSTKDDETAAMPPDDSAAALAELQRLLAEQERTNAQLKEQVSTVAAMFNTGK